MRFPLALAVVLVLTVPAICQVFTVSRDDAVVRTIDPTTAATTSSVTMSLPGSTINGANGLALDPTTSVFHVILKLSGVSGRVLAQLNPVTGACTLIGNTGDNVAGIAFSTNGVLYAVTGDGASTPETLFTVSTTTGTMTQVQQLGAGNDGEAIAFSQDDGFLYHASGLGIPNVDEIFERINPCNGAITPIPLSGADYDEAFCIGYEGAGVLLLADISDTLHRVTTAGVVTVVGTLDHTAKGIAVTLPPPPTNPNTCAILSVTLPAPGAGDVTLSGFAPGNSYIVLVSFMPQNPTGSGILLGVGGDAWPQLISPIISGTINASGGVTLNFTGLPSGLSVDLVGLSIGAGPALMAVTNVVNATVL